MKDTVVVDFTGKHLNRVIFQNTQEEGKPTTMALSGPIPAWQEALQKMNEGATWEIIAPPELAYGTQGLPPLIEPNEALIFKVKLHSVKPAKEQNANS